MSDPAPSSERASLGLALGFGLAATLLLLALRAAELRSVVSMLHHGEFNGLGRLLWDLRTGSFEWRGFHAFWDRYQYQTYAQGTVYTQVAAAGFARLLGPTSVALHATSMAGEAALVFALAAGTARRVGPRWALPVAAVLLLPPALVVTWQLAPYGNHTEFLVFPALLGLWLAGRPPEERGARTWLLPLLLIPPALVLYRGNAAAVAALACALLATRSGRRATRGLAMLLLAAGATYWTLAHGIGADLTGIGPQSFGAEVLPDHALAGADRGEALRRVPEHLPAAPRWWLRGRPYRLLLALGGVAALSAWLPGGRGLGGLPARFGGLWALAALAVPVLAGEAYPRYLVPAWYALVFCWIAVLMDRRAAARATAAGALLLLAVGGGVEQRLWVRPDVWAHTAGFDGPALWYRLEVNHVDLDELPYYRRLLDEGRGSRWVGVPSNWAPAGCRTEPLFIAEWSYFPYPGSEDCRGYDPGTLRSMIQNVAHEVNALPEPDRAAAWADLGRGLWIRSNRSMRDVDEATSTLDPALREAVRSGARDEDGRWTR